MAPLLQESSRKMAHVASREEGYAVIGSMLSSLGDATVSFPLLLTVPLPSTQYLA
jgi:hypothetical protein